MLEIIHDQLAAKLDSVKRFNGNALIKEETVSQHSYWVMFYVNLILQIVFRKSYVKENKWSEFLWFFNAAMRKAMFHDFDEVWTGDVIFPTKYHDEVGTSIKEALQKIVTHEINQLTETDFHDELKMAINYSDALTDDVIKIADWLSLYHFLYSEYKLGNKQEEVIRVMEVCKVHLKKVITRLNDFCIEYKIPYSETALLDIQNG